MSASAPPRAPSRSTARIPRRRGAGDRSRSQFLQHAMPSAYLDFIRTFDRAVCRWMPDHPVQWGRRSSRYSGDHGRARPYPEYRMRWRSTGIRWTVAKTLTPWARGSQAHSEDRWEPSEFSKRTEDHAAARQRLGFGQPRPRLPGFGRGQPLGMGARRIRIPPSAKAGGRRRRLSAMAGVRHRWRRDGEQQPRAHPRRKAAAAPRRAKSSACGTRSAATATRSGSWTASWSNEVTQEKRHGTTEVVRNSN